MLDLNSMYPDSEDLTEAFNREFATLRDSLSNIEQLFKRVLQGKTFLDDEELAELLHCKVSEIPQSIPRYRGSRAGYLYRVDEILEFLEGKRIPKRQN